jgi:hypothetical protein
MTRRLNSLFPLGGLFATPGAIIAANDADDNLIIYVNRHAAGDWGDLSHEDMLANAAALSAGTRLLSVYHLKDERKVWVITEAGRSATTILLPEEY